jgi:uncharacterized protein
MLHGSVRRGVTVAAVAAGAVLLFGGIASAHVTVNPQEAAQGDYAKLAFRVPDESDVASTIKVSVSFPEDAPLASVRVKPHDGWRASMTRTKLAKPVTTGDFTLDEAVTAITWTAKPGTKIAPGEFDEFEVSVGPLPAKNSMTFQAVQTYDNGDVVRWNQPTKDGADEPEHPAPTLMLVKGTGDPHGAAGSSRTENTAADGPAASAQASARASAVDPTARALGGAALGVGILCLAAALVVVLRRGKPAA